VNDDRLYLNLILESITAIRRYTAPGSRPFFSDRLVQKATIRELQEIAESTQRLSAELKSAYLDVDWRGLSGFRNVLVHGYVELNLNKVWEII
jgi:uncharacterized protein with HEPN domain